MKLMTSNLKKIFSVTYGNCTEAVQTMMKSDAEYEEKSKAFDCSWILIKREIIVSGLDTKVNLRVSLHTSILNFTIMRQYDNESNDTYLTRFKSMIVLKQ